jgi:heme/copper-type cytochrome/quinol oxidase subunit 2
MQAGWRKSAVVFAGLGASVAALLAVVVHAQDQGAVRQFTIGGHKYAFAPAVIDVQRNDLVKITFTAEDIAHSFTVDEYRIAKRAGPGQTVTFEFRADQPGTFRFYCNLTQDDGCRNMRGELHVR